MRVLTVRQPWAWAIVRGGKDVENRTRNLAGDYRGPIAIQVGLTLDEGASGAMLFDAYDEAIERGDGPGWRAGAGHIIGVVDLVDVHEDVSWFGALPGNDRCCSEWADKGAKHLVLANPRPLVEPLRWRGALHLQRTTEAEAAEILRRVS